MSITLSARRRESIVRGRNSREVRILHPGSSLYTAMQRFAETSFCCSQIWRAASQQGPDFPATCIGPLGTVQWRVAASSRAQGIGTAVNSQLPDRMNARFGAASGRIFSDCSRPACQLWSVGCGYPFSGQHEVVPPQLRLRLRLAVLFPSHVRRRGLPRLSIYKDLQTPHNVSLQSSTRSVEIKEVLKFQNRLAKGHQWLPSLKFSGPFLP